MTGPVILVVGARPNYENSSIHAELNKRGIGQILLLQDNIMMIICQKYFLTI